MALLTVQILAALSLKIAARDPRLIHAIADSLFCMGEGEAMELVDFAKDKKTYLELAFRKTGSLFSSAAQVGAMVGGGSVEQIKNLTGFGNHIGLAKQLVRELAVKALELRIIHIQALLARVDVRKLGNMLVIACAVELLELFDERR